MIGCGKCHVSQYRFWVITKAVILLF